MEKLYLIVACPRCQVVQVVDGRNKSRACASCNRRFHIHDLPVLGTGKDAREARRLVTAIKASQGRGSNQR